MAVLNHRRPRWIAGEPAFLDPSSHAKRPKPNAPEVRRSYLASEIEYSVRKRLGAMRRIQNGPSG